LTSPSPVWRLVPAEPSREMWAAMGDAVVKFDGDSVVHHDVVSTAVWEAAIEAAPLLPEELREQLARIIRQKIKLRIGHGAPGLVNASADDAASEILATLGRAG
jgi:hypothetical protein